MRLLLRSVFVGLLAILIAGCGRRETNSAATTPSPSAPPTTTPAPLRKVVLQTDWFPQGEHGGFYQALAKGFYREAGLDVDIWPGGPGSGIKFKVAKGDADFGMNRSDDIMLAAAGGMPLVIVAATLQHDHMGLMVHADSPVKTFKDLNGRTVIGNVGMAYMPFLERRYDIKFEKRQNTFGLGEFLSNPDLVQQGVVTNEPFFAEKNGRKVRSLPLASSGYDCYHVMFCRRELIRTAPEVVRAFVQASIRGWRDYIERDPGPADAIILKRNPQMTQDLLHFSRSEMIARHLVEGDRVKGEDVGQLTLARLSEQMETLRQLKIMTAPLAIESVATRDFLPPASALPAR